jgi:hypothetical protein
MMGQTFYSRKNQPSISNLIIAFVFNWPCPIGDDDNNKTETLESNTYKV